jgi:hypothetical protein
MAVRCLALRGVYDLLLYFVEAIFHGDAREEIKEIPLDEILRHDKVQSKVPRHHREEAAFHFAFSLLSTQPDNQVIQT